MTSLLPGPGWIDMRQAHQPESFKYYLYKDEILQSFLDPKLSPKRNPDHRSATHLFDVVPNKKKIIYDSSVVQQ